MSNCNLSSLLRMAVTTFTPPARDGTPGDPAPGEGLYNMSALYTDGGILLEEDEVCGDLPGRSVRPLSLRN